MSTVEQSKMAHDNLNQGHLDPNRRRQVQTAMRTLTPEMATAIGQMMLLYGIPFDHLVPDWRMLPPNSMRFFHVDSNWLDSLLDGAFSVGIHSERDLGHQQMLTPLMRLVADQAAPLIRPAFQDQDQLNEFTLVTNSDGSQPESLNWCGFLLRSPVVAGWPGLEVVGYRSWAAGNGDSSKESLKDQEINLLRLERVAPDMMLAIFDELAEAVVLYEPAEGLHFGFFNEVDAQNNPTLVTKPRNLATGAIARDENNVEVTFRDAEQTVLNINQLVADLTVANAGDDLFSPADFALQMIATARKQIFTIDGVN